ncbi:MAG: hypothetical protein Tsb0013_15850 [Phycisphaerales bacterium]
MTARTLTVLAACGALTATPCAFAQHAPSDTVVSIPAQPQPRPGITRNAPAWANGLETPSPIAFSPEPPGAVGAITPSRPWTNGAYTEQVDLVLRDVEVDIEGNVILTSDFGAGVTIEKLNGAVNTDPTFVWSQPTFTPFLDFASGLAVDLDGNIYVSGQIGTGVLDPMGFELRTPGVVKVSPEGFIAWQRALAPTEFGNAPGIRVGEDGVPFVSFTADADGDTNTVGDLRQVIAQLDPRTGAIAWQKDLHDPGVQSCAQNNIGGATTYLTRVEFALDRAGAIAVRAEVPTGLGQLGVEDTLVLVLEGGNGATRWCARRPIGNDAFDPFTDDITTDAQGDVWLCGVSGALGRIERLDGRTGAFAEGLSASDNGADVIFSVIRIAPDGSVVAGGQTFLPGDNSNAALVMRARPGNLGGPDLWFGFVSDGQDGGSTLSVFADEVIDLDFDRFGNVYVASNIARVNTGTGLYEEFAWTTRFKLNTSADGLIPQGTKQWEEQDSNTPTFRRISPVGMATDRGGNTYVISSVNNAPESSVRGRQVLKVTQPVELAVSRQRLASELKFENQSIWGPGAGNLVENQELFTEPITFGFDIGGIEETFIGDFGFQFKVDVDGLLKAGLRAEVQGGSADAHLPFDIEYVIPNPDDVAPGSVITLTNSWTPDPAARLTSCFTPSFNAGLTAGIDYDVCVQSAAAFFTTLFDVTFIDVNDSIPEDYVPGFNLIDLLSTVGFFPAPGEWLTISIQNVIEANFRTPQLFAQGGYDKATGKFTTVAGRAPDRDGRFFSFRFNVTEAILRAFGGTSQFEFERPESPGSNNGDPDEEADFKIAAGVAIAQLQPRIDFGIEQRIDVEMVPRIMYTFPNSSIPTQTLDAGEPLTFTVPSNPGGAIEILPFLITDANLNNQSDFKAFPGLKFDLLTLGVSITAFGVSLVDTPLDGCLIPGTCFDWDLSEILDALGLPGDVVNLCIPLPAFNFDVDLPIQQLPCLRIVTDPTTEPVLAAASRSKVDLIIYDQTSPSVSSFNVSTDGSFRMLLFGDEFTQGPQLAVKIEHNGRIETLTEGFGNGLTFINENTLLVDVPNVLRVTPGIAKVWVEDQDGFSDTIDLPVEYPTPRLDAVNPNLWAADPDLAVVPVSVIDAKSFTGNDTYIARRDYWIKMRDELWTDFTAGGLTATEYFPLFDFDQLPGFPAVLWKNGVTELAGLNFPQGAGAYIAAQPNPVHNRFGFLTLEAVVRPDLGASGFHQILTVSPDGVGGYRWGILPNGAMRFTTWAIANYDTPPGLVPDGVWSHVAVVFTSGKCEFYVNGDLVSTVNQSLNSFDNPNAQVMIGGTPTGDRFVGDLGEVRFWNTPRTQQQIRDNLARPLAGTEDRLIGYWPLDGLFDFGMYTDPITGFAPGANGIDDVSPTNAIAEAFNIADTPVGVFFPDDVPIAPLPLPRFIQPVDNGIFNVRLAETQYDRPQLARVCLCNPGPGGGMSNELTLTIAAPIPVVSAVSPPNISPLDIPFDPEDFTMQPVELTVFGPRHVPTFAGYEEPKSGNFNADSTVFFNDQELETVFVSSSVLTAWLPPELITEGDHMIFVATPSNGTQYFEQRFRDMDGDGQPDDEDPGTAGIQPFEQMLVDSGGVSAPALFRVRYREPSIDDVNPSVVEQNSFAFDDSQFVDGARDYNLVLMGADFRPGIRAFIGDSERTATFLRTDMVGVKLLPEDVDTLGTFEIRLANPGTPAQLSQPAPFRVIAGDGLPDMASPPPAGLMQSMPRVKPGGPLAPVRR